jgi:hypothetical protein
MSMDNNNGKDIKSPILEGFYSIISLVQSVVYWNVDPKIMKTAEDYARDFVESIKKTDIEYYKNPIIFMLKDAYIRGATDIRDNEKK